MPASSPPTENSRLLARERPPGVSVMRQRWEHLLFLHWRSDPGELQRTLPRGLQVDLHDNSAWLGVVPIFMRNVRPRFLPRVPFVSDFLELNLRTYVYDAAGRPGVFFYSLDCNQPLAVTVARRLVHLRYEHSAMAANVDVDGNVRLECRRADRSATDLFQYRVRDRPTAVAAAGAVEYFLIERYRLFADHDDALLTLQVHHAPYRLGPVDLIHWGEQVFVNAGLEPPRRPPDHVCAAAPVDLEVFAPHKVPAA